MLDFLARISELEAELADKDAHIVLLQEQVATLTEQARVLMERLGQNSKNSHLPPSSDGPGQGSGKLPSKKKGSKRKRGGQRGHKGHRRELLPASAVDHFVDIFPKSCTSCWAKLDETSDAKAIRFQVTELPEVTPHTTEYRRHAVTCSCGHTSRATDSELPMSCFGPRLMSVIALLTGVYHLSRRKTVTVLSDLLGVSISLGGVSGVEAKVSAALESPTKDVSDIVEQALVKHTDATGWLKDGVTYSLWTIATKVATIFKIMVDGKSKTIQPLFGSLKGILVSDRATVFGFWAMERRQICWAHLMRKFVSFSERDGPAKQFGNELLQLTGLMFEYWHNVRDGTLTRATFLAWMAPVRCQFETLLERAVAANITGLSGSAADVLKHKQALWTFVDKKGVEPTNNHAERELRAFVLWRKRSFGAKSDRGNLFAERIMTIAHTARKQDKNVLAFLTQCCEANIAGTSIPSLF